MTVTGPLRLAIASPIDGTLFTRIEPRTTVEVNASLFRQPTDLLRSAFPMLGIKNVVLFTKGSAPIPTRFENGKFVADVPLELQGNHIMASATSFDGRTAETFIDVTVRPPGCSEFRVSALRDGRPAISVNDRGLEVIFDASNSMWGQIDGTPKITIAKDTVRDVMTEFPEDIRVALRVYGHQYSREQKNCEDSELLVPLGTGNVDQIRSAIDGFKPKGQTPLGFSVEQVPADFGDFEGERAVVLITDGIESCDGDAVAAAEGFQAAGPSPADPRHRLRLRAGSGRGAHEPTRYRRQHQRQVHHRGRRRRAASRPGRDGGNELLDLARCPAGGRRNAGFERAVPATRRRVRAEAQQRPAAGVPLHAFGRGSPGPLLGTRGRGPLHAGVATADDLQPVWSDRRRRGRD